MRLVDPDVRPVGEPGGHEGAEHRHVAQPAVGLLEVGLEALGQVAVPGCRALRLSTSCGSRRAGVARASRARRSSGPRRRPRGRRRRTARSSSPTAAARSPDATVRHWLTVRTAWSSRTPASQTGYQMRSASAAQVVAAERAPVVQQDQVDVAERAGVTARQAADRGERDPLGRRPSRASVQTSPSQSRVRSRWLHGGRAGAGSVEAPRPARSRRRAARSVCSIVTAPPCPSTFPDVRRRVTPVLAYAGARLRGTCHPVDGDSCATMAPGPANGTGRHTQRRGASALRGRRRRARRCGPGRRPRPGRSRSCRHRSGRSGRT